MARQMLVAGNWKMNGTGADVGEVTVISLSAERADGVDSALCVPATMIERAAEAAPGFVIGGQDLHANQQGAHTGDISGAMLREAGAEIVIVGHSERRADHHESNEMVAAKAQAAFDAGLDVILCVGESLDVREAGKAIETVKAQLSASLPDAAVAASRLSVAYEPIWAIGTGKVAELADIEEMHAALRSQLAERIGDAANDTRILYGGSVKAANAADIFAIPDVDGALVGGASLKAADFVPIIEAAEKAR